MLLLLGKAAVVHIVTQVRGVVGDTHLVVNKGLAADDKEGGGDSEQEQQRFYGDFGQCRVYSS